MLGWIWGRHPHFRPPSAAPRPRHGSAKDPLLTEGGPRETYDLTAITPQVPAGETVWIDGQAAISTCSVGPTPAADDPRLFRRTT